MPLSFDPGEAYQFDWSHEYARLSGVTTKVKAAHMRLCDSRMQLVQIFPRESQEMVFEAHERAFHFFGGVCRRGIYDNMKTAVSMVFVGKERAYNRRFLELCSHHLVEPVACTPGAGWEKGQVERQVGYLRGRLFVPIPRGGSLDPSRKSGGALHSLHCFCLEFDGACEVQRRVPTDWIIEPIDVSGYGSFSLAS